MQRYLSMRSLGEARKAAVLGLTTTMILILCVGWMGLVMIMMRMRMMVMNMKVMILMMMMIMVVMARPLPRSSHSLLVRRAWSAYKRHLYSSLILIVTARFYGQCTVTVTQSLETRSRKLISCFRCLCSK